MNGLSRIAPTIPQWVIDSQPVPLDWSLKGLSKESPCSGCASPTGSQSKAQGNALGIRIRLVKALKGRNRNGNRCCAPLGLGGLLTPIPRALPWAFECEPVGLARPGCRNLFERPVVAADDPICDHAQALLRCTSVKCYLFSWFHRCGCVRPIGRSAFPGVGPLGPFLGTPIS